MTRSLTEKHHSYKVEIVGSIPTGSTKVTTTIIVVIGKAVRSG